MEESVKMKKIKVNQEVCIGCGNCVTLCPDCFEIGDDGKSHVKKEECDCGQLVEAKDECPVRAISLED